MTGSTRLVHLAGLTVQAPAGWRRIVLTAKVQRFAAEGPFHGRSRDAMRRACAVQFGGSRPGMSKPSAGPLSPHPEHHEIGVDHRIDPRPETQGPGAEGARSTDGPKRPRQHLARPWPARPPSAVLGRRIALGAAHMGIGHMDRWTRAKPSTPSPARLAGGGPPARAPRLPERRGAMNCRMAGFSVRAQSSIASAGTRPFPLIARYGARRCSPFFVSIAIAWKGTPVSSSAMWGASEHAPGA